MGLSCALCLHMRNEPPAVAATVISGTAVCDSHVSCMSRSGDGMFSSALILLLQKEHGG